MNILITFSGAQYASTTKIIVERGHEYGADKVLVYDDVWLTNQYFYHRNRWLWDHSHKRGFGWYAWKPFIILDAFKACPPGSTILFIDADCRPLTYFGMLFEECQRIGGVMLFGAEKYSQKQWCKRDCYIVMAQDQEEYRNAPHAIARFMLFQNGPWMAQQFLSEWLAYCINPLANTFDPSVLAPEYPELVEHRAEQSILSNLAHKYRLKLFRQPDSGGDAPEVFLKDRELYGKLFDHDNPNSEPNRTMEVIGSEYRNV